MKRFISLILFMLCTVYCALGATYSTKNGNYKFEESTSWSGGELPGDFVISSPSYFNSESGSGIHINGKIYMNGDLKLINETKLTLNEDSYLIVDGDLYVSDSSYIRTYQYSNLYVKGNLITVDSEVDEDSRGWYTFFDMWKKSNITIEGDATSTSGASIVIYPGTNTDFYVFGDVTGTVYKTTNGKYASEDSHTIDDESDFSQEERYVTYQVNNLSSILSATYSYKDYISDDCVLTIPENTQIEIPVGDAIKLTGIVMKVGATLVNNGTIDVVTECEGSEYADFDFASTCYPDYNNGNTQTIPMTFTNNGSFRCKNYDIRPANANRPIYWTNTGNIICTENFYMSIGQNHNISTICGSKISATNQTYYSIKNIILDGVYICDNMTITLSQGGNTIDFGSNCDENDVSVMNNLILKESAMYLNINGVSTLNGVNASGTYSTVTVQVDGEVYIGNTTSNVTFIGSAESVITLCYNATVCDHKTNINSTNNETCGDGYAKTYGAVKFRVPTDSENASSSNAWLYNFPYEEYNGNIYNSTNFDVLLLGNNKDLIIPNKVSYEDCINRQFKQGSLLPIELVSFDFDKNNYEFVWTTASETNNDYFVVEYSKNGKDWVECTEQIKSKSDNGYTYNAKPSIPINNSLFSYFRLKQVDLNGEYSYSKIITVSFQVDNPCSEEYESSKVQIKELNNKYFRYINGRLIYCENDNN